MPKKISDVKDFLAKASRKDAKGVKIHKSSTGTKFKIRCSRFLYTLKVTDAEKAKKLEASIPASLEKKQL